MVLPDLVLWLEQQSVGTRGTDLFYGLMPSSPDLCVCVFEYGGLPNEPHMGGNTVNLEFPSVQVMVRGAREDYDTPRLRIQQVVAALAKIGDTDINGVKYGAVVAKQPPFPLAPDENFRFHFACNFSIQKGFSAS